MKLNYQYTFGELTRGILQEEPKKGGSKEKQMKHIESLYKVEQLGRKYILVEKYDKPKEIEDGRGKSEGSRNNNDSYQGALMKLVAHLCCRSSDYCVALKRSEVQNIFNFVSNYSDLMDRDIEKMAKDLGVESYIVEEQMHLDYIAFNKSFRGALNKLKDKGNWRISELFMVKEENCFGELEERILFVGDRYKENEIYTRDILTAEKEVMEKWKIKDKYSLIRTKRYLKFLNEVCSKVREKGYKIKSYSNIYYINGADIEEIMNFILPVDEIERLLNQIRDEHFRKSNQNAENRHKEALAIYNAKYKCTHAPRGESEKRRGLRDKYNNNSVLYDNRAKKEYTIDSSKAIGKIVDKGLNGKWDISNELTREEIEPNREIQDKIWEEYLKDIEKGE